MAPFPELCGQKTDEAERRADGENHYLAVAALSSLLAGGVDANVPETAIVHLHRGVHHSGGLARQKSVVWRLDAAHEVPGLFRRQKSVPARPGGKRDQPLLQPMAAQTCQLP